MGCVNIFWLSVEMPWHNNFLVTHNLSGSCTPWQIASFLFARRSNFWVAEIQFLFPMSFAIGDTKFQATSHGNKQCGLEKEITRSWANWGLEAVKKGTGRCRNMQALSNQKYWQNLFFLPLEWITFVKMDCFFFQASVTLKDWTLYLWRW